MPAIKPDSLVLVTGASGFIAIHCVRVLLTQGHRVRGTVRSAEKGEYIKSLFGKRYPDRFEYVVVEDLEHEGAFDAAAQGVDGVLHTASPFHFDAEGRALDALVHPAVNGTKNVLRSILKAKTVQRVVITSSFAAIIDATKPVPTVYTEDDWNEFSPANSAKEGNKQAPPDAYRASKTLAERAAWEFVEANKPGWDVATINPPLVFGPIIHQVASVDKLNTSMTNIWGLFHGGKTDEDLLKPAGPGNCVDVRDVALAHVLALTTPEAGGHRFAATIGLFSWQEVADIVHASESGPIPAEWKEKVPVGTRGAGKDIVQNELRGGKLSEKLGLKYHSLAKTVEDSVKALVDYEKRGWKGSPSEEIVYL